MYNNDIKDEYALIKRICLLRRGVQMRSDGKHVKKKKKISGLGIFAIFLLIVAIIIGMVIGGFILWVYYGEEGDGKADDSGATTTETVKKTESVTIDVSSSWSVPGKAFKGSIGYGKFVSK